MRRARIVLAGVAAAGCLWPASGASLAFADRAGLTLTATANETGWIALAAGGPADGIVDVHELVDGGEAPVAMLSLGDGRETRAHAARWRCAARERRFVARLRGDDAAQPVAAAITTPSCADRLRLIVVPGQLRPGASATVRVADSWGFGAVAARLCARPRGNRTRCTTVRLRRGRRTLRTRVRLFARGSRTIALTSRHGQHLEGRVEVRRDARLRLLVTGDSMIYGLYEVLGRELGAAAVVRGDPHPGRGITTPGALDWTAHALRSARIERPDVTAVFLGSADAGYALPTPSGGLVPCCDRAWIAAYASRASSMMGSYLRSGRSLVYWLLLPAPRSAVKARVTSAENDAVRLAAADHPDGVRVIARLADIVSPGGRYREAIELDGRRRVVRDPDGVHLASAGIDIAAKILDDALRGDGLLGKGAGGA